MPFRRIGPGVARDDGRKAEYWPQGIEPGVVDGEVEGGSGRYSPTDEVTVRAAGSTGPSKVKVGQGIGFAVPIDAAAAIMAELRPAKRAA